MDFDLTLSCMSGSDVKDSDVSTPSKLDWQIILSCAKLCMYYYNDFHEHNIVNRVKGIILCKKNRALKTPLTVPFSRTSSTSKLLESWKRLSGWLAEPTAMKTLLHSTAA